MTDHAHRARPRASLLAVLGLCVALALSPAGCGGEAPGRSVVIITLDTVRADHLGCYGFPLPTSPGVDALAQRGILFENAYAPMPQTLPSHATLFTGLPPRRHGALENAYALSGAAETLAEYLSGRGYQTAAFIGARILDDTTGMEQGFDVFDQPTGVARDQQHPVERRADSVTDSALAWALTRHTNGKPYLLWAHYYDAHGPWEPAARRITREAVRAEVAKRKEFASLPAQGTTGTLGFDNVLGMWHGYDNEIAEVDAQVSRLLDGLEARGLLEDAVVLVVGDHGEGLMEHDEKGHGVNVFQELMQVPLVIAAPDAELAGTRVASAVQMEDILPMLLALIGAPEQQGLPGRNVLPDLRAGREPSARPVFVERPHYSPGGVRYRRAFAHGWGFGELVGVIDGDDKLVRYPDGSLQLFDLAEDPDELVDRSAERSEVAGRLEGLLDEWLRSHAVTDFGAEQELSAERLATLEALGYVGGGPAEQDGQQQGVDDEGDAAGQDGAPAPR